MNHSEGEHCTVNLVPKALKRNTGISWMMINLMHNAFLPLGMMCSVTASEICKT